MTLADRNILIVGGRTGIGQAVVERAHDAGANLWCASRQPDSSYSDRGVHYIALDVTADDTSSFASALPEKLHGVVYCPGSISLKPFRALKPEDFRRDLELNLLGAVKILQACQAALTAAKGASVVMFSTVATGAGMNFHTSIAAAKSAVEGLAVSLAAEWAGQGIQVNVIAPSLTDTPLAERLLGDDKRREAAADRHPLKRIGTPHDMAAAVMFLLDIKQNWMSGQVMRIDGGLSALRPL